MRRTVFAALAALSLLQTACDGPCDDLEAVCEACPAGGDGPLARESCRMLVASGDEQACRNALDADTYGAFGCDVD